MDTLSPEAIRWKPLLPTSTITSGVARVRYLLPGYPIREGWRSPRSPRGAPLVSCHSGCDQTCSYTAYPSCLALPFPANILAHFTRLHNCSLRRVRFTDTLTSQLWPCACPESPRLAREWPRHLPGLVCSPAVPVPQASSILPSWAAGTVGSR